MQKVRSMLQNDGEPLRSYSRRGRILHVCATSVSLDNSLQAAVSKSFEMRSLAFCMQQIPARGIPSSARQVHAAASSKTITVFTAAISDLAKDLEPLS